MKLLNLGCGYTFHPDWVNVDYSPTGPGVISHDLQTPLPFPDNHFDLVYHSHVLEHLPKTKALQFLQECYRVLRPGGVIRVVVPDLEQIAQLYLQALAAACHELSEETAQKSAALPPSLDLVVDPSGKTLVQGKYDWILLELLDQAVRHHSGGEMVTFIKNLPPGLEPWLTHRLGQEAAQLIQHSQQGTLALPTIDPHDPWAVGKFRLGGEPHLWMYDRYSLGRLLKQAQFQWIQRRSAAASYCLTFDAYHLDTLPSRHVRKPDSLFMEALKPRPQAWNLSQPGTANTGLKIVHLSTSDLNGGAAKASYRLHQALLTAGQASIMVVLDKCSEDATVIQLDSQPSPAIVEPLEAIQTHGINRHRTAHSNTLFSFPYPGFDLTQLPEIQSADVINLHWIANQFLSVTTIQQLLQLGKPIIWTLHDMWAFTGGCHYTAGCEGYQQTCQNCPQLSASLAALPAAVLADKARLFQAENLVIVTPSRWLQQCAQASQVFQQHLVEWIPYSLPVDVFSPQPKAELKLKLGFDPASCVLLFVAHNRNETRKGFRQLYQALQLCQTDPDWQAWVNAGQITIACLGLGDSVGDWPNLPMRFLEYQADESVVAEIYAASDLLIAPSLEDNLPNTVLEAMSCGTPVLGFKVGGIQDLITPNQNGFLVEAQDSQALATGILDFTKRYLADPRGVSYLGAAARQTILECYHPQIQAKAYLQLYQDRLSQAQPTSPETAPKTEAPIHWRPYLSGGLGEETQAVLADLALPALSEKLREVESQNAKLAAECAQTQELLAQVTDELTDFKLSKFWKIRQAWFDVKARFSRA